ncbi:MAG: MBL fold metallo-hydrolase [Desulfobacterales bacterium]|nr:MBL fold metallo-hydrolase [Desulfobacterales bacterium]
MPKANRNSETIAIDLNIEPEYILVVYDTYGPVSDYVNTHAHMDHAAHMYVWEQLGATLHAPHPEAHYLTDLYQFYKGYGWDENHDFSLVEQFAKLNKFQECKNIQSFQPGDTLTFENFYLETIPFTGHSKSHVGFLLPTERILHLSCLGFDQPSPGMEGFGPWYGFKESSIDQYLKDIDHAEFIFREKAQILTSAHAHVVRQSNTTIFDYMRQKISDRQQIIDHVLQTLDPRLELEDKVSKLLELDLFFPKNKIKGFLKDIYSLWESWIIRHHIQRNDT